MTRTLAALRARVYAKVYGECSDPESLRLRAAAFEVDLRDLSHYSRERRELIKKVRELNEYADALERLER